MKAVIPAAGLGTRFLPFTKNAPKEMLPLVDKPAIQYVVEEAVRSGCDDIIIVTGRGKQLIEDHFDLSPELERALLDNGRHDEVEAIRDIAEMCDIQYVRQKEPLGLGHAVYQARRHIGDHPFAVLLGDDIVFSHVPCTKQLIAQYERTEGAIVAVEEIADTKTRSYGVVDPLHIRTARRNGAGVRNGGVARTHANGASNPLGDKEQSTNGARGTRRPGQPPGRAVRDASRLVAVRDLVEKPEPKDAPSRLGILGRYVLPAATFDALRRTRPGAGGEIQLTDALRKLCYHPGVHAYRFKGRRFDLGNKMDWLATNIEVAMQRPGYREHLEPLLRRLLAEDHPLEVAP